MKDSAKVTVAPTKAPTATPTAAPTATAAPTEAPTATAAPTEAPTATPVPEVKVTLDQTEAVINKELTLSAKVENAAADAKVVWASSDEKVATVADGKVTPVADGTATISATVGTAKAECKVTVDKTAPAIEKGEVVDYKTLKVTFKEAVKAADGAKIEVFKNGSTKAMTDVTATVAEDGMSATVTAEKFAVAEYTVKFTGYTDKVGNAFADKTNTVNITKEESIAVNFKPVCDTVGVMFERKDAITGSTKVKNENFQIYFKAIDQYGEEVDSTGDDSAKFSVVVTRANGDELTNTPKDSDDKELPKIEYNKDNKGRNYVTVAAKDAVKLTLDEVLTVKIKHEYDKAKEIVYTGEFTVKVEQGNDTRGVGVTFESFEVSNENSTVKNTGTATAPEFTVSGNKNVNLFKVKAVVLDKYGYPADANEKINFKSSDANVLAVYNKTTGAIVTDAKGNNVATKEGKSGEEYIFAMVGAGTASVTAYVQNTIGASSAINVKVNPAQLVAINNATDFTAKNGKTYYKEITTNPSIALCGLKASDFTVTATTGAELATLEVVDGDGVTKDQNEIELEKGKVYVKITPVKNGKENVIEYKVAKGNVSQTTATKVTSKVDQIATKITIKPFAENSLKGVADKYTTTTFNVENAQGEDITKILFAGSQIESNITGTAKDKFEASQKYSDTEKAGVLKITCKTNAEEADINKFLYVYVTANGMGSTPAQVKIVKDGTIASVRLDKTAVETINMDSHPIAGDTTRNSNKVNGKYYTLIKPTVTDSYDTTAELTLNEWKEKTNFNDVVKELAGKGIELIAIHYEAENKEWITDEKTFRKYTEANANQTVQFFGVIGNMTTGKQLENIDKEIKAELKGVICPTCKHEYHSCTCSKVKYQPAKLAYFYTTVREARKVVSVAASANSVVVSPDGEVGIDLIVKDQYGEKWDTIADVKSKISDEDVVASVTYNYNEHYTIKGGSKVNGNATLTFYVDNDGTPGYTPTDPQCSVSASSKNVNDITSIAIGSEIQADANKIDKWNSPKYDSSQYYVKASSTDETKIKLEATAAIGGTPIGIDSENGVLWQVKSTALLNANNATYAGEVSIDKNVITIKPFTSTDVKKTIFTGTITVVAKSVADSSISAEKTFTVSSVAPKAQAGTYYASDSDTGRVKDWTNAVKKIDSLSYTYDENVQESSKSFYVFGIDQYGKSIKAISGQDLQRVVSKDEEKVKVSVAGNVITTTAVKKEATTDVVISIANEPSIKIPVTTGKVLGLKADSYFLSEKKPDVAEKIDTLSVYKTATLYLCGTDEDGVTMGVNIPDSATVTTADDQIADVITEGNKIKIFGWSEDTTTLTVKIDGKTITKELNVKEVSSRSEVVASDNSVTVNFIKPLKSDIVEVDGKKICKMELSEFLPSGGLKDYSSMKGEFTITGDKENGWIDNDKGYGQVFFTTTCDETWKEDNNRITSFSNFAGAWSGQDVVKWPDDKTPLKSKAWETANTMYLMFEQKGNDNIEVSLSKLEFVKAK